MSSHEVWNLRAWSGEEKGLPIEGPAGVVWPCTNTDSQRIKRSLCPHGGGGGGESVQGLER